MVKFSLIISIATLSMLVATLASSGESHALSGKNLLVIPMLSPIEFRVNDSAQLQEHMSRTARMQIDILNWLARRNNFTYSVCGSGTNETTLEKYNNSNYKGAMSYLLDKTCDMVIGDFLMTNSRYRLIDMPYPWVQTAVYFLIPVTDAGANFAAILKPFQMPVWILLAISVIAVIISFKGLSYYILSRKSVEEKLTDKSVAKELDISYLYVVGILISQGDLKNRCETVTASNSGFWDKGAIIPILISYLSDVILYLGGPCTSKRLTVRLVAGVWCLVAFVLGQAYNSTFITYVIAPNNHPLMNSIHDVINNPNIRILVEEGWGMDIYFSSTTDEDGMFKILRDRINNYPYSRCKTQEECIERLRSGGPYVSPKPMGYILDILLRNFQETGECRMQIAKEGFLNLMVSFALTKGSRYTNYFSEGVMEMNEFGLIKYWIVSSYANPYQCLKKSYLRKQSTNSRLSLKNLTGAFAVLLVGWGASLFIFMIEQLNTRLFHTR